MINEAVRLICPICSGELHQERNSLICSKKHSYDIARQGYVNLLPVQNKKSLNPGDPKEMLLARRRFLDSGMYLPVSLSLTDAINKYCGAERPLAADIGCGEGYYTAAVRDRCNAVCVGADISKDGVKMSCSRGKNIGWIVATASHLPLADESTDAVSAVFSLVMQDEYARILKKGGCVVEICAGNDHLIELKRIIYEEVFEQHKHPAPCTGAFTEAECTEHRFTIRPDRSQLSDLLLMTPHFWRMKKERRELLEKTEITELTVHYWLRVLIRK